VPADADEPGPGRRAGRTVGAVGMLVACVLLVVLFAQGGGRGARGLAAGSPMPPFAVPLVGSRLDADANLATHDDEGAAGRVAACSIHRPGVLNGCDLWRSGPAVVAFVTTQSRCLAALDGLQRVLGRRARGHVAAVAVRGDRDALRRIVASKHYDFSVGYDRDGALAARYQVQVCPQLTFARAGGRVSATTFGALDDRALARRLGAIGLWTN
jgi:hypothetical protein